MSSPEITSFLAKRPCFTAFCEEFALPSSVFGPVEDWAFVWFAVSCSFVDIFVSFQFTSFCFLFTIGGIAFGDVVLLPQADPGAKRI